MPPDFEIYVEWYLSAFGIVLVFWYFYVYLNPFGIVLVSNFIGVILII